MRKWLLVGLVTVCGFFSNGVEATGIDLLANPKFVSFIEAFGKISHASASISLDEGRRLSTEFFLPNDLIREEVKRVEDVEIIGKDENPIKIRFFIPKEDTVLPVFIYFHRGGWVFGNVEEADPVCRKLANHLGCIIASVEYRLAPENPFPKPLDDCYAATEWIAKNAARFGGDSDQIIVGGESAGGNLAGAVCLMARNENGPKIAAEVLIYPIITSSLDDMAYENSADQFFLTKEGMKFFWSVYLPDLKNQNNPYASLDCADLKGLPPTLIITAEYDPLKYEAENYSRQLRDAGVHVVSLCFPGVIHGFLDIPIYEESQKIDWIQKIKGLLSETMN